MQETITCPSGLKLLLRNMKAKELSLLAAGSEEDDGKQKAAKKRDKTVTRNPTDAILTGCTLEVVDLGPYKAPFNWKDVLIADRFVALLRVRVCTWGAGYEFRIRCKDVECVHHKKPFLWEEDLDGLEIKALPQTSIDKVKANDLIFEIELAGKKSKFKLLQGKDEGRSLPEVPKHKVVLAQVASRLIYVEGQDVTKWDELLDWVGEIDLPELVAAKELFESVDGGVQTNTVVECPGCGLEFDTPIPFGAQAFLLPDKRTTPSKQSSTGTDSSPQ